MDHRVLRMLVFSLVFCVSVAGASASAGVMTEFASSLQSAPEFPEQDGMLDEHMSPDDDGDTVPDIDDSHPNDPTRGTKPPPGPTDPVADDDGDGLPNVMDPDDNDNGMPDAEEGVRAPVPDVPAEPDTPPTPGEPETPRSPVSQAPGPSGRAPSGAPVVRAFPSTGSGTATSSPLVPVLLIGSTLLFATGRWSRRKSGP